MVSMAFGLFMFVLDGLKFVLWFYFCFQVL